MKTCPYCAEQIQDAAIFCRFCRRDLYEPQPAAVAAQPRASIGRRLWAMAVGYFVVAIAQQLALLAGRSIFRTSDLSVNNAVSLTLYVGYPAATLLGGFVAGRRARSEALWIGFSAGCWGVFFMWMDAGYYAVPGAATAEDFIIAILMLITATIGGRLAK